MWKNTMKRLLEQSEFEELYLSIFFAHSSMTLEEICSEYIEAVIDLHKEQHCNFTAAVNHLYVQMLIGKYEPYFIRVDFVTVLKELWTNLPKDEISNINSKSIYWKQLQPIAISSDPRRMWELLQWLADESAPPKEFVSG